MRVTVDGTEKVLIFMSDFKEENRMKNFIEAAQYAFAALGGALGAVMGGFDGFLYALVVFVIVDYATGLMAAAVEKKLSSEVGFKGIFKKVIIFSLVAVGHIVDAHVMRDLLHKWFFIYLNHTKKTNKAQTIKGNRQG